MSEIIFDGDPELYKELGLTELTRTQVFEEDPRLLQGEHADLKTSRGFLAYFESQEDSGSPAAGYSLRAYELISYLSQIGKIENLPDEKFLTPYSVQINMRPESVIDPELFNSLSIPQQCAYLWEKEHNPARVYDFEQTSASLAFRGAIDMLLHSRDPVVSPERPGSVLYRCLYHDINRGPKGAYTPLWLMETRDTDEVGDYALLELFSHQPYGFEVQPDIPAVQDLPQTQVHQQLALESSAETPAEQERSRRLRRQARMWNPILDKFIDINNVEQKNAIVKELPKVKYDPDSIGSLIRRLAS